MRHKLPINAQEIFLFFSFRFFLDRSMSQPSSLMRVSIRHAIVTRAECEGALCRRGCRRFWKDDIIEKRREHRTETVFPSMSLF